jgi:putative restriction endonuclease
MLKLFVAVTDNAWFRFLKSLPEVDELNFWQPSGNRQFQTLHPGEPFVFKLHSPENFIVGGGFFAHSSLLPCSLAWEAFGPKNGAPSLEEMRRRVEKYRRATPDQRDDYMVGCIILQSPFFFDESEWIPVPPDFSLNIVQGKTYDTDEPAGQALWEAVRLRLQATQVGELAEPQASMFGKPVLIRPRLGQGTFRVLITDTYERRCAVTQEKALPVLEAAHVRAVAHGGTHRIDNGLLLRSDIHRLFDSGYVTVTAEYRFLVSQKLRDDFENGEPYYPLAGSSIWLPRETEARPRREFLEWHADTVFKG